MFALAMFSSATCSAQVGRAAPDAAKDATKDLMLTLNSPSATQAVDVGARAIVPKFVRVELAKITNPARHSLAFEVDFVPDDGKRIHLGSFSPFPADNPGKFIVATQGKVTGKGRIVVTMVADQPGSQPPVATIKSITLGEQ